MTLEQNVAEAFVDLIDTMVDDYDVVDLLDRLAGHCVQLLSATAAGLMLTDQRGNLEVLAASTERTRVVELFQLQAEQGPCFDCYGQGEPVFVPDLSAAAPRWPQFAAVALDEGFAAVHALPMRLRTVTIGALNLFFDHPADLDERDRRLGQALADVATIGILHERSLRRSETLVEQLQGALNTRVVIEQAKGVIAERANIDPSDAFTILRDYARSNNTRLADIARQVVQDHDIAYAMTRTLKLTK